MLLTDLYDGIDYIEADSMANLNALLAKMNELEGLYGKKFVVSSGYRSRRKHRQIYAKINKQRLLQGKDPLPIPIGSRHLTGQAVDCYDPPQFMDLKIWTKLHVADLERIGLWCEDFSYTPTWVHFQSVPPKSGIRFFKPF